MLIDQTYWRNNLAKTLAKTTLSATTLAFMVGSLGCAHAKTNDATQPATQNTPQTAAQNIAQNSTPNTSPNAPQTANNTQDSNNTLPDEGGTPSAEDAQTRDMMKFSHNGHTAMIDIGAARLAMFDGHPKAAVQLMDQAQTALGAAQRESADFKVPANTTGTHTAAGKKMTEGQNATLVPVDGRMTLGEDYVATPEKQSHLDKANQHLKNGETKAAMDEFKLAGVDVNFTLILMPIDSSKQELQDALSLANQGKYYQANLQLKKIEDSLILTQESLVNTPKNGKRQPTAHTGHNGAAHTSGSGSK